MHIPIRVYDKTAKKMLYPEDLGRHGIFFTAKMIPVQYRGENHFAQLEGAEVMLASSLSQEGGATVWEQDVCDCDIPTDFGSLIKARGVVGYDIKAGGWTIFLKHPKMAAHDRVDVANVRVVGNVHENPALINQQP